MLSVFVGSLFIVLMVLTCLSISGWHLSYPLDSLFCAVWDLLRPVLRKTEGPFYWLVPVTVASDCYPMCDDCFASKDPIKKWIPVVWSVSCMFWVHPVPLDLLDFNYRLYNYVAPLYTVYRPPACKLRKWLMRNYICSTSDSGRSKFLLTSADPSHHQTSVSIYQKKAFGELYSTVMVGSCEIKVYRSYAHFQFFLYKFQLNENTKVLGVCLINSHDNGFCVKRNYWDT